MNQQLLIIDDDRATHDLVSAHMASSQIQCISALDGAEGIRRAVESVPSAILLDMDMPKLTGMEVCWQLKANPQTRQIPILFLTGDRTTSSKVQGMDMGAADYVTKPFDPFELRARVRSVIRMAGAMESAHALAGVDESTGLWNRTFLFKQIEACVASAARSGQMVSCCFASIDRFDELAAKMGQPYGEDLIRDVAERIAGSVRAEDIVGRYDTRTIAVLGFVSEQRTGRILAERLRSSAGEIGLRSFVEPETVTCSVGMVASRNSAGPLILRTAERALAEAQLDGNCIVQMIADETDGIPEDRLAN